MWVTMRPFSVCKVYCTLILLISKIHSLLYTGPDFWRLAIPLAPGILWNPELPQVTYPCDLSLGNTLCPMTYSQKTWSTLQHEPAPGNTQYPRPITVLEGGGG